MRKITENLSGPPAPRAGVARIQKEIAAMDWACPGTLSKRWKQCGRPYCRCAKDRAAWHGPYYEWSRMENGVFRHTLLSPWQAQFMQKAIANHKRIMALLRRWGKESALAFKVQKRL